MSQILRRLFHFLHASGHIASNPAWLVDNPKVGKALPAYLEEVEVRKLLDRAFGEDWIGLRDRAMLETVYGTGMRASELTGLDVDDVDFGAGSLRVMGKGGRERDIPLTSAVSHAIREYLHSRPPVKGPGNPLFINRRCARVSRWMLRRVRLQREATRVAASRAMCPGSRKSSRWWSESSRSSGGSTRC